MVARDGNFYFRKKTSLGTGFSAWTVYWILATVYRHPRYWAATINWNGQKRQSAGLIYNPTSPIIGPVGHYFTPGLSWSTRKSSTVCLSKHKVNIFQTMLKNIIDSRCGFNIKETQVCVCVWVDFLPRHHNCRTRRVPTLLLLFSSFSSSFSFFSSSSH